MARLTTRRSNIALIDALVPMGGGAGLYGAGTLDDDRQALTEGTHPIPAGAYYVHVLNSGAEPITVNGDTVPIGESWQVRSEVNHTNKTQDFCPAVSIVVPAGGNASFLAYFPS